jgi:hypothetical protein
MAHILIIAQHEPFEPGTPGPGITFDEQSWREAGYESDTYARIVDTLRMQTRDNTRRLLDECV